MQYVCRFTCTVSVCMLGNIFPGWMRVQLFLPRVNWTRHSVVAVIHSVRSPAVASHTLRTVISGHSKVLVEEDPKTRKRAQKVKNGLRRKRMTKKTDSRFAKLTNGSRQKEQGAR